jgi:hypothetical protein
MFNQDDVGGELSLVSCDEENAPFVVYDITLRTLEATVLSEWQFPVVIDDIIQIFSTYILNFL